MNHPAIELFRAGMVHIAEGSDHLMFLLLLLVAVPLRQVAGRWAPECDTRRAGWRIAGVVTAFTLGHSLTLVLGQLGWMPLPARWVELCIAGSILLTALHLIRPLFDERGALVAGGFGLVHGMAFASSLHEVGLKGGQAVLGLIGFNLGIEAMQLLVVVMTMPWVIALARTPAYRALRWLAAGAGTLASLGWIAERGWGLQTPVDDTLAVLQQHPLMALALLASAALLAQGLPRSPGTASH